MGFGWPYWYGSYYYPYAYRYAYPYYYAPYAYEPYAYYAPAEPVAYIERNNRYATREQSSGYWHYCRDSNTYYPYTRECAGQWERVPATPASER